MRDGWGEDTDLTETSNAFNALMGHLPSPRTSFCFFNAQSGWKSRGSSHYHGPSFVILLWMSSIDKIQHDDTVMRRLKQELKKSA